MPTDKEPCEQPAESQPNRETTDVMSLVDYFDRMDRAAFMRSLEHRDHKGSIRTRR